MGNLVAVRSEDGFLESQDQSGGVGIMTPIPILISEEPQHCSSKWVHFSVRRGNQNFALKECFHMSLRAAAL